jgi:hypothetical protein
MHPGKGDENPFLAPASRSFRSFLVPVGHFASFRSNTLLDLCLCGRFFFEPFSRASPERSQYGQTAPLQESNCRAHWETALRVVSSRMRVERQMSISHVTDPLGAGHRYRTSDCTSPLCESFDASFNSIRWCGLLAGIHREMCLFLYSPYLFEPSCLRLTCI